MLTPTLRIRLGLNSILDLSYKYSEAQSVLFTPDQWRKLRNLLAKKGNARSLDINPKVEKMLCRAESLAEDDIIKASDYIYKCLYRKNSKLTQKEAFTLFAHAFITEFIAHNQYMFDKSIEKNEQDFIVKFWGPLLEKLVQNTGLRLRWGESSCSMLPSRLRADVRVIYDRKEGQQHQEHDMMQMEASRMHPPKQKFDFDHTKLLVETKDIIDSLESDIKREMSCFQFCGLEIFKYSLSHKFNTLYVNNQVDYHIIPSDVTNFQFMRSLCVTLVATRDEWMSCRKLTMNAKDNANVSHPSSSINESDGLKKSPSWYPPRPNQRTSPLMAIPVNLH